MTNNPIEASHFHFIVHAITSLNECLDSVSDDEGTVYLHIYNITDEDIECPVYTALVLFLQHYCTSSPATSPNSSAKLSYVLVSGPKSVASSAPACVPQGCVRVPASDVMTEATVIKAEELSDAVQRCVLPVAMTRGGCLIHSGLCTVLRLIVKHLSSEDPALTALLVSVSYNFLVI